MLSRLWNAAIFLLIAVPMMSAAESSPIPKHFSAYICGFMGPTYGLELHGGILTYTTFGSGHSNPKHTKLTPTATQWSEFRQALDDQKVWQWRTSYRSMGTLGKR